MSLREGFATRRLGLSVVAAALIALLVAGCAAVEKDRRTLSLDSTTRAYLAALRWSDFEGATVFLPPEMRPQDELPPMFNDLRITGFEILRPPVMLTDTQATQVVAIEYLYEYNQIVRKTTDRQSWRWDDEAQAWWLESGFPAF
jgi:hypothetical protein